MLDVIIREKVDTRDVVEDLVRNGGSTDPNVNHSIIKGAVVMLIGLVQKCLVKAGVNSLITLKRNKKPQIRECSLFT